MSAIKQGGWTSQHDGHGGVYIGDADGRQIGFISNRRDQDEIAAFIVSAPDIAASHQRLKEALAYAESAMTYTQATVSPGNTSGREDGEWVRVHGGRAYSSYQQLRAALDKAREALRSTP